MDHKKSTGKKMAKAITRSPVIQALQLKEPFVVGAIWQQKQSPTHITCEFVALADSYFVA
jgi:hypothetical protein